jgi:hypothetical protein
MTGYDAVNAAARAAGSARRKMHEKFAASGLALPDCGGGQEEHPIEPALTAIGDSA